MEKPLKLAYGFTSWYGMLLLSNLDTEKDADYFNVTPETIGRYMDASIQNVIEHATEEGEVQFLRPMIDLLVAYDREDIKALGLGFSDWADLTFPGAVLGATPDDEWKLILEYTRHKLFGLPPMTDDEKRKVKQDVTIIDESLEDFRSRMRAEGRLPAR